MPPLNHRLLRPCFRLTLLACWLSSALALNAQPVATGTLAGRIYNPATREYVRHAEIRVDGTVLQTASEEGGHFTLPNVPAGPAVILVAYTGYGPARHSVAIAAGQTLARDFDLGASTDAPGAPGDRVVQLGAFVVSSEREGYAKAIMNQRNSMDLGTSIASDVFGDVTEGNVGEFLNIFPASRWNTSRPTRSAPASAAWTRNIPASPWMA